MKNIRRIFIALLTAAIFTGAAIAPASAAKPGFGNLYYDGEVVRTVVPPAATPKNGIDPFYVVNDGADGQLAIAGVAPGDTDYHGGKWAVHVVTWITDPYLLTSDDAVFEALENEHVTVSRNEGADFKCPIQGS